MIYRNSYFDKELRGAYMENRVGTRRKVAFAIFLGFISFAVHFILQTMIESVLSKTMPYVMQASFFSTVYTYISVAFLLYMVYYIVYYDYLSFAEIRKNRWYLLVKMGYRPRGMIASKLMASIYSLAGIYSIGFVTILILTFFLKYHFVYSYLPALFVVGLFDLIVFNLVAKTVSLYVENRTTARYMIFFSAVLIIILRTALGYQTVVTDRVGMQNLINLFDFSRSVYLPVAATLMLACLAICIFRAGAVAKYYSLPYALFGYKLPEGENIVRVSKKTGKVVPVLNTDRAKLRGKILDAVVMVSLVIFICSALAVNVFIILLSTSQPGKEVTIRGVIPYIFKSDTMEPTIMENDLAYFNRIDSQEKIDVGDIVLFQENKVVYVERVTEIENGTYSVDIDYYPPMSEVGAMKKSLDRTAIYGVYTHANRWLGALILFSNTIFGRLLFLLVPAFLLFFYQPIKSFFAKNIKTDEDG